MAQNKAAKEIEHTRETSVFLFNRFQEAITMSLEDLAGNLLSPTDMKKCRVELHTVLLFKRWVFNYNKSTAEHWQKALGRSNPNAEWSFTDKFDWTKARKKIMKKYRFVEVNYIGRKLGASGLRVKSVLETLGDQGHLQKVEALVIDFKSNTKDNVFLKADPTKCIVQHTCSLEEAELLKQFPNLA